MHVQADPLSSIGVMDHQASCRQHAGAAWQEADDALLQVGLHPACQASESQFLLSSSDANSARIHGIAVTTPAGVPPADECGIW